MEGAFHPRLSSPPVIPAGRRWRESRDPWIDRHRKAREMDPGQPADGCFRDDSLWQRRHVDAGRRLTAHVAGMDGGITRLEVAAEPARIEQR